MARSSWRVTIAGGMSYDACREAWSGLDISNSDQAFGGVVQATLARRLSRRVAALVRGEYSMIRVEAADPALGRLNLGSLDLLAGMSFAF